MADSMSNLLVEQKLSQPASRMQFSQSPGQSPSPRHVHKTETPAGVFTQVAHGSVEPASFTLPQKSASSVANFSDVAISSTYTGSSSAFFQTENSSSNSPQLISKTAIPQLQPVQSFSAEELPLWFSYPATIPAVYHTVYGQCQSSEQEGRVITEQLYPLLLSSGLDKTVLRDLWTISNRAIAGVLNKQELFVLLGLVGLAQVNNTFTVYMYFLSQ